MKKVPLSPKWHRALEMLATAGERGNAEAMLISRGFSAEMLKSLVRIGLATPSMDLVPRTSGQRAPWMRITDAGRQVLAPSR
jgi:hypothetical protein